METRSKWQACNLKVIFQFVSNELYNMMVYLYPTYWKRKKEKNHPHMYALVKPAREVKVEPSSRSDFYWEIDNKGKVKSQNCDLCFENLTGLLELNSDL